MSLFSLKAQEEGFNRAYHIPPESGGTATGLLELDSSYLILCGFDTNLIDYYGRGLMFMELDRDGDTIRTNKLVGGKVGNWWGGLYESLVEAPDSGYYLVGGYEDTGSGDAAVLYRIGPDLDTMWTRFFGAEDTLWNKFTAIEPLPSGDFLITGERGDTAYGDRAWYLKVDPQGQVIWERKIGAQKDKDFKMESTQRTIDGGFITGGWIPKWAGNQFWTGLLIKLDSMGNKEWQRNFTGNYGYWVSTVHEIEDTTYLAGGGKATYATNGQPWGHIGILREYDKNGNLLREKEYYPDTSDPHNSTFALVRHMDRGTDGSLIFAGWKHLNPIINPDSIEEGWVYRTDPEGNLLWMRGFRYHELGEHILWNVREVEQKRILAVGRNSHPDTTNGRTSPWVLKLDSMGCVTPGCAVGVEEEGPELTSAFTVFPNPNEGRFRIRSERGEGRFEGTLTVRDMKGRVLLKRSLQGNYPFEESIRLPESSSGVHFVEWRDGKGRYVRKVVVER